MLTYIPVSFLFYFKKGFGLGLKIGFGFGIGNLIGGAVGTVGFALARRLSIALPLSHCVLYGPSN